MWGIKMWKIDVPELGGLDFLYQIGEWDFLGDKFLYVSIKFASALGREEGIYCSSL